AKDWIWKWHEHLEPNTGGILSSPVIEEIDAESLEKLKARLEWKYPFEAGTKQEAKTSATALRRGLTDEPELARPVLNPRRGGLEANEVGQAAHRFLEHARFETLQSSESVRAEIA